MSFVKLNQNNFAMTSVVLNADRKFVSSSSGVTGALKVIVDRSHTQKDSIDDRAGLTGENTPQPFGENTFEGRRKIVMDHLAASGSAQLSGANNGELDLAQLLDGKGVLAGVVPPEYEKYNMFASSDTFTETGYSDISMHPRNSTELLVRALKPTSSVFSSGSMALALAERILEPYYRPRNSAIGSKFVNFNCLSFFEPTSLKPALIYDAYAETNNNNTLEYLYDWGDGDFSIEFWIKLRDTQNTGTIIHYPGFFSVSVLSGSETNEKGFATNYGLGVAYGSLRTISDPDIPYNLNFGTDSQTEQSQYSLVKDVWQHCAITFKSSTGDMTIYIDGKMNKKSKLASNPTKNLTYSGLVLGSYWKGNAADIQSITNDTIQGLSGNSGNAEDVSADDFVCQLNADIHEVRYWTKVLSTKEINGYLKTTYTGSYSDHRDRNLKFYVPGLYDVDYRFLYTHLIKPRFKDIKSQTSFAPDGFKYNYGNTGANSDFGYRGVSGSIQSQFNTLADIFNARPGVFKKLHSAPYNTNHANIGNFANVNIQSFLKDFANINFPHCLHLSESLGDKSATNPRPYTEEYAPIYATGHALTSSFNDTLGHQARNCFILPCDNGDFRADYKTLYHPTGSKYLSNSGFYINTKNIGDVADLYDTGLFFIDDVFAERGSFISPAEGASSTQGGDTRYNTGVDLFSVIDEDPTDTDIPDFKIPSTSDETFSNIFDESDFPGPLTTVITVPQLYYGRRIKPGSLKLSSYLYNDNQARIELRDNGYGVLYRHQSSGSIADWNKVGDVYYGEGLVYIRHPSLYAFSDSNMEIEFKSESEINVFEASIPCQSAQFNSSSNPNYNKLKPSANDNETADEFVYVSTIYLHDDNLNVIGKAKLAQPVIKRPENKYLFRVKLDY